MSRYTRRYSRGLKATAHEIGAPSRYFGGATTLTSVSSRQPAAGPRSLKPGDEWIGFPLQIYVCPVEEPEASIEHQVDLAEELMKWLQAQGYRAHLLAEFEDLVDEKWLDV